MAGSRPEEIPMDDAPKVLLCGPHKAGKTSILKVVFQKMSPHETLFLETTPKVDPMPIVRNMLLRFKVMDFPGSTKFDEVTDPTLFAETGAIVFVLDAQDEPYTDSVSMCKRVIEIASRVNPKISFDILIHKVDGVQFFYDDRKTYDDHKTDLINVIETMLTEDLQNKLDGQISFHCTSIYDHTVFEAMSKVVQKLYPQQLQVIEQSLDLLVGHSRMEKAFLFDVVTKVFIATDTSQPVDLQAYELCSDMIDVVIDVSCIYGSEDGNTLPSTFTTDPKSSCVIHLNNRHLLYLREVDKYLAVVCIIREENFDRQHLLDHNIRVFKEGLGELFKHPGNTAGSSSSPKLASSA
eukprot:TRINITY_DN13104_c0_g1_i1.p1 TRINITY_DN13104_c0_g1~~TRINITY_DN13104_c0_g1_i1.p1  ORF type:complete len:351 (-),score=69.74 TRINITY_DN13104_c0_g1_i1:62-1114(-)